MAIFNSYACQSLPDHSCLANITRFEPIKVTKNHHPIPWAPHPPLQLLAMYNEHLPSTIPSPTSPIPSSTNNVRLVKIASGPGAGIPSIRIYHQTNLFDRALFVNKALFFINRSIGIWVIYVIICHPSSSTTIQPHPIWVNYNISLT